MENHIHHAIVTADRPLVIDFLSRTAEVLLQHEVISEKIIQDLRLSLKALRGEAMAGRESLLLCLFKEESEYLLSLNARLGEYSLFANLLRFSMQGPLAELEAALGELGQDLLKKAELMFNRPLYIFRNQQCEAQILASSLLVDICEDIAASCQSLKDLRRRLSCLVPSQLHFRRPEDHAIDQAIASRLGFPSIRYEALPFRLENQALIEMCQSLQRLAATFRQAFEQMRRNEASEDMLPLFLILDRLQGELSRLSSLAMSPDDDLMLWESRRYIWLESLAGLGRNLKDLAEGTLATLKASRFQLPANQALPASMSRRLLGDMISAGRNPRDASAAVGELLRYCRERQLRPSHMVAAELKKVHPLLNEQSLKLLQEMDIDRTLATQSGQEKKTILDRSVSLMVTFSSAISAVFLALIVTGLGGCGFKTDPVSEVLDFRPPVPYRTVPTSPDRQRASLKDQKQDSEKADEESIPSPNDGSESP